MDPDKFRILIIDDNPSIHQDFQKIFKAKPPAAHFSKLNKLLFGGTEEGEASESSSNQMPTFQIDYTSQGEEGVRCIKAALEENQPYALAFVDVRMPPGIDGIETIKRIWALDGEIQIVICTAYSDYSWEETIEELGVKDNLLILKKPFDNLAVRQLACSLTKKWRLMQDSKQREAILEVTIKERTDSLQESVSMLEHQATHDNLTSLPNRALLMDRVKQEIARSKRNNSMFAVIFIDLDRFKLINDSFNHEAGDTLLKLIADRLANVTREEDTIARLSGDEFIFIAVSPNLQKIENMTQIANRILNSINESLHIANRDIMISASLGISIYPQDGDTVEELLHHADLAMYRAKAFGGNQFQLYTSEMQERCITRLEIESDLRRSLVQNDFFLEYQPQYNLKDQQLIGVEALVRWNHPEKGVLMPIDFIPLAEETGLIVPLGEWVIETACRQNKEWQDKGMKPIPIAVNIATKQFMQPNFISMIKNVLNKTKLDPKYLEVEVTENVILNTANVIDSIKELKKIGISIALDDFGTGSSGFNYLRNLPIDQLKIDKSFINNINCDRADEVMIQAIINMANSLNLDIVAEGIETDIQLKFLESIDCHKVQGFYFKKPLSLQQFEEFMKLPH
jgi:diguanylate cyclase (GGDEF)-like protein